MILMVRRRVSAVSNHEARLVASSFETPLRGSSATVLEVKRFAMDDYLSRWR
jgi:hypothetical protein